MQKYLLIKLFFVLLAVWLGMATAQAKAQQPTTIAELHQSIEHLVQQHQVASISYALVKQGQVLQQASIGVANRETNTAADVNTQYRLASASKMIVSIAIMQLVESEQLALSTHVKSLLPELPFVNPWEDSHPLQLVHLLENTTGWDEIPLQAFAFDNIDNIPVSDALPLIANSMHSRWPPGTRHAYTNSTSAIAAWIVERATGMSFTDYAQQYIFAPLGIANASYSHEPQAIASGYQRQRLVQYKPILFPQAGGLALNIQDATRLLAAFVNRDNRILQSTSYTRIESSHSTNAGEFAAGYGLFNYARYYDGYRYRGHDGAFPGWLSEISYSPANQVGFVVLQNSENPRAFRAIVTAITVFIGQNFATDSVNHETHTAPADELSGYYRYHNPRMQKRYFLERFAATFQLRSNTGDDVFSSLIPPGWIRHLHYVGSNEWVNDKGEVVMRKAQDPVLGEVLHYGDRVFQRESIVVAWLDKVLLLGWLLLLMMTLLLAPVWLFKILKKRYAEAADRKLRWSILATFAVNGSFLVLLLIGMRSPIHLLGKPTIISVGLLIASLLFFASTVWLLYRNFATKQPVSGLFTRTLAPIYCVFQGMMLAYLTWFGVVGIVTWS